MDGDQSQEFSKSFADGVTAAAAQGQPAATSILGSVMAEVETIDPTDDQAMGNAFGNMFRQMRQLTIAPPGGEPEMANIFTAMFGPEMADRLLRDARVKVFFEQTLKTHTLNETIRLTKAEFNLPDDYELEIKMTVQFKGEAKTSVPEID